MDVITEDNRFILRGSSKDHPRTVVELLNFQLYALYVPSDFETELHANTALDPPVAVAVE